MSGGNDNQDITLSQAFTNFKYLVIFNGYMYQNGLLGAVVVDSALLYKAMLGDTTFWPGNNTDNNTNNWITLASSSFMYWEIKTFNSGSTETLLKRYTDVEMRIYSIYGLN